MTTAEPKTNSVHITNRQRIIRIFHKICQSKLPVFMRTELGSHIIVKGRADELDFVSAQRGDQDVVLMIANLSEKGVQHLFAKKQVHIEFVMMATKIVCQCQVLRLGHNYAILALPPSLSSVERRQVARYKTTTELSAFAAFSLWSPERRDLVGPPFFSHQESLAKLLSVVDVSLGGICVATRFASVTRAIVLDSVDPQMRLFLPMQEAYEISVNVRWIKKRIEHSKHVSGEAVAHTTFLVGCMFVNQGNEDVQQHLKRFMQQLIEAEAI